MGRPPKNIQSEIDELENSIENGLLASRDEALFSGLALAAKRRVLYYRDLVAEKNRAVTQAMEQHYQSKEMCP